MTKEVDYSKRQINYLTNLFNEHSYFSDSHISKNKLKSRMEFLFKNALESKFTNNEILKISLVYLSKILKKLNNKICHKKFKCVFVSTIFLAIQQTICDVDLSLEDIYEHFNLFVHYIHLEDLEKWFNNSLIVLNFDVPQRQLNRLELSNELFIFSFWRST